MDLTDKWKLRLGVRQIFIHGSDDDQVPVWLSSAFVDAANAAGDHAEFVLLEGAGHFDMVDPQSKHWPRLMGSVASILS